MDNTNHNASSKINYSNNENISKQNNLFKKVSYFKQAIYPDGMWSSGCDYILKVQLDIEVLKENTELNKDFCRKLFSKINDYGEENIKLSRKLFNGKECELTVLGFQQDDAMKVHVSEIFKGTIVGDDLTNITNDRLNKFVTYKISEQQNPYRGPGAVDFLKQYF